MGRNGADFGITTLNSIILTTSELNIANTAPLVSIIIPNYNRADLIGETLTSVQQQTYDNWEAIVVDDGSTDDSKEVIAGYANKDRRIRLITRTSQAKGAPSCRNIGLKNAAGELVLFLDSDDLLDCNCLEHRVEAMNRYPELDYIVFPIQFFEHRPGDQKKIWLYHSFNNYLSGFLFQAQWQTSCAIWKRTAVLAIGGWNERLIKWQDWDFHVRALMAELPFRVFTEPVDCYYRVGNQRMSAGLKKQAMYENRVELFDQTTSALKDKGLLTDLNKRLMAGNYLTLAGRFQSISQHSAAATVWRKALEKGLITSFQYHLGNSYLKYRRSGAGKVILLTSAVRKIYRFLLPKYVVWKY